MSFLKFARSRSLQNSFSNIWEPLNVKVIPGAICAKNLAKYRNWVVALTLVEVTLLIYVAALAGNQRTIQAPVIVGTMTTRKSLS